MTRPKVTVQPLGLHTRAGNPRHLVTCNQCTFAYLAVTKADANFQARCHRNTHSTTEGTTRP